MEEVVGGGAEHGIKAALTEDIKEGWYVAYGKLFLKSFQKGSRFHIFFRLSTENEWRHLWLRGVSVVGERRGGNTLFLLSH